MGAPQYEQAGADIGGTGTTNTIPRWTGASTLGDSVMVQDANARAIGVGVTPNASWPAVYRAIQLGQTAAWMAASGGSNDAWLMSNSYWDGTSFRYLGSGQAMTYAQTANGHTWSYAGAGTAGNPITFTTGMILNTSGSVGIGTASPNAILSVYNASTPTISLWNSSNFSRFATNANDLYIDTGLGGVAGATVFRRGSGTVESARIDSAGNLILNTANTGATIQAAGSQQGLKLPNAPGNTDPNTLDSYREGTRVLAAGDLSGWTYVTATQYWTLVGRTVTLHTIFTGGTSSATGGATIATPPLLTPLRIAAGAAVNSAGTALGNGVCVVASTSSTTGTVTTSSAISSSALDKVITVTYETAGL